MIERPPVKTFVSLAVIRAWRAYGRLPWWRLWAGGLLIYLALGVLALYPAFRGVRGSGANAAENAEINREIQRAQKRQGLYFARDGLTWLRDNHVIEVDSDGLDDAIRELEENLDELRLDSEAGGDAKSDAKRSTIEQFEIPSDVRRQAVRALREAQIATRDTELKRATIKINGLRTDDSKTSVDKNVVIRIGSSDPADMGPTLPLSKEKRAEISQRVAWQFQRYAWAGVLATAFSILFLLLIILRFAAGRSLTVLERSRAAVATARVESSARQIAEAKLKAMQAQIEPHFLFNTLAHVKALQEIDVGQSGKMLDHLITYLRGALPNMREGVSTLEKEFNLVRDYLSIIQIRMDQRLQFSFDLPDSLRNTAFPPAILVSLVENAVKHGLEPAREGGSVRLAAQRIGDELILTVSDTGRGLGHTSTQGTGVGLANARERLALLYGPAAVLTLEANSPKGCIASLRVPIDIPASVANTDAPATTVTPEMTSERKILVALCLLWLGGGLFGVHNWYLGRKRYAFFQVIAGIPFLGSLGEGEISPFLFIAPIWWMCDTALLLLRAMRDGDKKWVIQWK